MQLHFPTSVRLPIQCHRGQATNQPLSCAFNRPKANAGLTNATDVCLAPTIFNDYDEFIFCNTLSVCVCVCVCVCVVSQSERHLLAVASRFRLPNRVDVFINGCKMQFNCPTRRRWWARSVNAHTIAHIFVFSWRMYVGGRSHSPPV